MLKSLLIRLSLASFLIIGFYGCQKDNDPAPVPPVPDVDNKVPVAHAGLRHILTLPVDTVNLIGSGMDSDGVVTAYLWSQVSGPEPTILQNPGSPATMVQFSHSGSYLFQLMVVDNGGATGVDTVSVLVNPSPIPDTLVSQPSHDGSQALIWGNANIDQSGNATTELDAAAWTFNGDNVAVRGALKFDLSAIPKSATIVSANLYLYSDPTPLNGNGIVPNFGTNNSMVLQEINQNWDPTQIHWTNQPTTTTTNQVLIPATTLSTLDINVDVTANINDMVQNTNYGFMFRLQSEQVYNSRIFCSGNYTDASKHPKLVVLYKKN